ncbi:hypothetical protein EMIT0111MI5_10635 [Burkholderia sp. IT-111MI5]
MPGQVDAGCGNADPVARPDRQDLTIASRASHEARDGGPPHRAARALLRHDVPDHNH